MTNTQESIELGRAIDRAERRIQRQAKKAHEEFIAHVRAAFADYWYAEGCSCCRDIEKHDKAARELAQLLDVPMYADKSGYDFSKFRREKQ